MTDSEDWNPAVYEKTSDGWYWDGLLRFEDRATANKQLAHMQQNVLGPLFEAKVIKRGGSADPHFRVVIRPAE